MQINLTPVGIRQTIKKIESGNDIFSEISLGLDYLKSLSVLEPQNNQEYLICYMAYSQGVLINAVPMSQLSEKWVRLRYLRYKPLIRINAVNAQHAVISAREYLSNLYGMPWDALKLDLRRDWMGKSELAII